MRARILCAALLGASFAAADAGAWQSHYLYANTGGPFAPSDYTTNPADVSVDALNQVGVPGVSDAFFFAHAAANSDTGILLAETSLKRGPEAPSGGFVVGSIEQYMEIDDAGAPVTIDFRFDTSLSAQRVGTGSAQAAARIDVTSLCTFYVEVSATGEIEVIDNCTDEYAGGNLVFTASGGTGAIHVQVYYEAGYVPNGIDFHAQVENDVNMGYAGAETALAHASGALSISVAGAQSYSFTSPTFLTAPEAGPSALGLAALGALAIVRTRRSEA